MENTPTHQIQHAVAVVGGATAGAEVSGYLAERGCYVAVFEQNPRPYGKIEDGLPRWHVKLRRQEFAKIDAHLSHPNVDFVPLTRIGRDLDFMELVNDWGFDAVVLACGAWRDRPLPLPDAEQYVGRGLAYQNPFIYWFNHHEEAAYNGPECAAPDGSLVIGGGLASLDVAKVLVFEPGMQALAEHGVSVDVESIEHAGFPKLLQRHGLSWETLGLRGSTLLYRRRMEDMPVVDMPEGLDEKKRTKIEAARRRLVEKAMEKYGFNVLPLRQPEALLVEDGRVVGLRLRVMRPLGDRKVEPTQSVEDHRAPLVVSSIGSIPEPIAGLPMVKELFDFEDPDVGRLRGFSNVFAVGNVVTGRGNIVASRRHAAQISEQIAAAYLGVAAPEDGAAEARPQHATADDEVTLVAEHKAHAVSRAVDKTLRSQSPVARTSLSSARAQVASRQRAVGYPGDYHTWIQQVWERLS